MTEEREGICKFMEATVLELARILGDIIRIQNELDELEKCSEINQSNRICQYSGSSKHKILQSGKKIKHTDAKWGLSA